MARYTGPKNRICRIFGEPILGSGKNLSKNSNPPGSTVLTVSVNNRVNMLFS
jgi:hypothetical protein